ncbi:arfaptin-1 isoform X2 [Esox lucius]|uniref:AH domain-containing protein n=1 Tax=Esox lucius TaxID=8010 RepID=A0A6Q2Y4F6_ESOLU|nr:arfaptin-1 isoform X2 [Esox lucius]
MMTAEGEEDLGGVAMETPVPRGEASGEQEEVPSFPSYKKSVDENHSESEPQQGNNHSGSEPDPDKNQTGTEPDQGKNQTGTELDQDPTGSGKLSTGPVVVTGNQKTAAIEKLERVRKWSITTYKCTKQVLSEKMGRGSRTVDPELEARVDILRDDRRRYDHVTRLAQTLATQLTELNQTQRTLGDVFADLSLKTPPLHMEFGLNSDTQRFLSKSGETLVWAINSFTSDMNTLLNKTIEDTMINVKHYETARVEYDAYRCDLEDLNLGPRDTATLPKLEQAQRTFQNHREKYERSRDDLSVKLKLLEENKVKVLHQQLMLFHDAVVSYNTTNHRHIELSLQQASTKLTMPGTESPSWLEESGSPS